MPPKPSSPTSSSHSSIQPTTRVKVTNLSSTSTEDSIRDYFSFCGDIKALHVYDAKNDTGESAKEALIKFETDSGATTACLITGALVDGRNIVVELFPEVPVSPGSATQETAEKATGVAAIVSEGKHAAGEVGRRVKEMDRQLGFSQGVKQAYAVGRESVRNVDERYHISEKASAAAEATRTKAAQIDEQLRISQRVNALGHSVASFLGIRTTPSTTGDTPPVAPYSNPPPTYGTSKPTPPPPRSGPAEEEKKD